MKKLLILLVILIALLAITDQDNIFNNFNLKNYFPVATKTPSVTTQKQNVVYEESTVTTVVERALPSVVTIGVNVTRNRADSFFEIEPFNPFSPFSLPERPQASDEEEVIEQNIGSGFIVSQDGLIITNRHVVSDTDTTYTVLTNDKKEYTVEKIYRDPLNDLAILKINATGLKALELGDSDSLKLGQLAIAIGTPLGEFTNTVTAGIVSGLGRGVVAGSPYEGYVEELSDVIQTDAAISSGNSGGPLLNSAGQVIGINTAVSQEGQNIGFALPVNIVRDLLDKFNRQGGSFERPYIGVRYTMIDNQSAILRDLVQGAYVIEVIDDSPAQRADIQEEDIITEIDGRKVEGTDDQALARMILDKKVGDSVTLRIWRNGEIETKTLTLEAAE